MPVGRFSAPSSLPIPAVSVQILTKNLNGGIQMEVTINYNGRMVSVEVTEEVYEFLNYPIPRNCQYQEPIRIQ